MRVLGLLALLAANGCSCRPLDVPMSDLGDPGTLPDADGLTPDLGERDREELVRYGWPTPAGDGLLLGPSTFAIRIAVPVPVTLEALSFSALERGGEIQLALYEDGGDRPGALLAETAVQSIAGPGPMELSVAPRMLAAGTYYLAGKGAFQTLIPYSRIERAQVCFRNQTLTSTDPWPASFGPSACGQDHAIHVYLVGHTHSSGDLGSADPPDFGATDGGTRATIGWSSASSDSEQLATGVIVAIPVAVPAATTIDGFGFIASAAGSARVALYHDAGGGPGALVAGTSLPHELVDGATEVDVLDRTIVAGSYWIAVTATGPSTSIGAGAETTRCTRNFGTGPTDSWPLVFGARSCAPGRTLDLYVITRD